MDVKTARRVRVGDTVSFDGKLYQVLAIAAEGLWAPYFELPAIGQVSHHLVELSGASKQPTPAKGRRDKVLASA